MQRGEVLAVLRDKARAVVPDRELAESDQLASYDSLVVVELVMDLEDATGVEISEQQVTALGPAATVGALLDLTTPG